MMISAAFIGSDMFLPNSNMSTFTLSYRISTTRKALKDKAAANMVLGGVDQESTQVGVSAFGDAQFLIPELPLYAVHRPMRRKAVLESIGDCSDEQSSTIFLDFRDKVQCENLIDAFEQEKIESRPQSPLRSPVPSQALRRR
jgi:hypothetical protein